MTDGIITITLGTYWADDLASHLKHGSFEGWVNEVRAEAYDAGYKEGQDNPDRDQLNEEYDDGYAKGCEDTLKDQLRQIEDMLDDNVILLARQIADARYLNEQVVAWRNLVDYLSEGVKE